MCQQWVGRRRCSVADQNESCGRARGERRGGDCVHVPDLLAVRMRVYVQVEGMVITINTHRREEGVIRLQAFVKKVRPPSRPFVHSSGLLSHPRTEEPDHSPSTRSSHSLPDPGTSPSRSHRAKPLSPPSVTIVTTAALSCHRPRPGRPWCWAATSTREPHSSATTTSRSSPGASYIA